MSDLTILRIMAIKIVSFYLGTEEQNKAPTQTVSQELGVPL